MAKRTSGKRSAAPETILNAVARRLGRAAGALANATHDLAGALSAMPETLKGTVNEGREAGSRRVKDAASKSSNTTPGRVTKPKNRAVSKRAGRPIAGSKRKATTIKKTAPRSSAPRA